MTNPLTDIIPARYRQVVYAVLATVAIGLSVYQAADGDWLLFAGLLLGALGFGTATSNTSADPTPPARRGLIDGYRDDRGAVTLMDVVLVLVGLAALLWLLDALRVINIG